MYNVEDDDVVYILVEGGFLINMYNEKVKCVELSTFPNVKSIKKYI